MAGGTLGLFAIMTMEVVAVLLWGRAGDTRLLVFFGITLPIFFVGPIIGTLLLWKYVVHAFLWALSGKEIVEASPQVLTLNRQAIAWKAGATYSPQLVSNLQVSSDNWLKRPFSTFLHKVFGYSESITFKYNGKTVRFGVQLSDADAIHIVTMVQQGISSSN